MSEQTETKTDPASNRKLRKQREQGSIANGQELASFIACAAGLLLLGTMAVVTWRRLATGITDAALLFEMPFDEAVEVGIAQLGETLFYIMAPLVGALFVIGFVASLLFNGGFVFSLKPVAPQLNRVSVKTGLTRIYGRRGWLETGISLLRLTVWLLFAGFIGYVWLPSFLAAPLCAGSCAVELAVPLAWTILIIAIIIILFSGVIEGVIQKNQFLHEQKMTKTEVKRERKDQFGSPEVSRERRRLMREAQQEGAAPGAKNGNLCFYTDDFAVAIRYLPPDEKYPYIVAKATDAAAVAELRASMKGKGRSETKAPAFVQNLTGAEMGSALDPKHYDDFVAALRQIYGT
ncbi:MAG: EscU/YscU/HrcU family type III secretion system export apparatus switch protein [Paracoccaceae bacterium]